MTTVFDVSTAYLIASVAFFIMPIITWVAVIREKSVAVNWWCSGGLVLSGGLITIGLREHFPDLLPFHTGFALAMGGNFLHIYALKMEGRLPASVWRLLGFALIFIGGKELLLRIYPAEKFHFLWGHFTLMWVLYTTSKAAASLARQESSLALRWMSNIHLVGALSYGMRFFTGAIGISNPDGLHGDLLGVLNVFAVIFIAIISNVSLIGLYLERTQRKMIALSINEEKSRLNAELTIEMAAIDRQRSMGELSAALAHELGQPVTGILMDSSALTTELQSEQPQNEVLKEIAQAITDQATRASQILQGIRNFIKPSKTTMAHVNLPEVIGTVQNILEPMIRQEGAEIRIVIQSPHPDIRSDVAQLSQVFLNLLRNSIQAKRPEKRIEIKILIRENVDLQEVVLEDNGTGMSDESIQKYAMPFYTTKLDGMGIGLAISKRIVEHHGGQMLVSHADSGNGLKTVLRFPSAEAQWN